MNKWAFTRNVLHIILFYVDETSLQTTPRTVFTFTPSLRHNFKLDREVYTHECAKKAKKMCSVLKLSQATSRSNSLD
jgi:hypothetical protein